MLTVEQIIRNVFRFGTDGSYNSLSNTQGFEKCWGKVPAFPPDIFSISSYLVNRSGAYALLKPGLPDDPRDDPLSRGLAVKTTDALGVFNENDFGRFQLTVTGHALRFGIGLSQSNPHSALKDMRAKIRTDENIGERVRKELLKVTTNKNAKLRKLHCDKVQFLWDYLIKNHNDLEVIYQIKTWELLSKRRKSFYSIILKLMIISDEACAGLGHFNQYEGANSWIEAVLSDLHAPVLSNVKQRNKTNEHKLVVFPELKLNVFSNEKVAPIVPKAKTAAVGCALRNMSQNMALVPPVSEVKTTFETLTNYKKPGAFNLLVIPFPFEVSNDIFVPSHEEKKLGKSANNKWRWFDVNSVWIPKVLVSDDGPSLKTREDLIDKFIHIIFEAKRVSGEIHAIVFPELALDYALYKQLAERINAHESLAEVEILISGTTNAACPVGPNAFDIKKGNFACTAIFKEGSGKHGEPKERFYITAAQHKHHRWKLNDEQIKNYNASHVLDPALDWWENINISTRTLHLWGFRERSILTTIICEDLARVDPAQKVIREVGPSLIVALLMDGPQMKKRWPGTYANTLSRDPGSSVLTVTSTGLMTGKEDGGRFEDQRIIALWAEKDQELREIKMKKNGVGVVLNLRSVETSTSTLDGRYQEKSAKSWTLSNVKDVCLMDK